MEKLRNDSGNNTDSWMNWIRAVFSTAPYWLMALGASTRIDICLEIDGVRAPCACTCTCWTRPLSLRTLSNT